MVHQNKLETDKSLIPVSQRGLINTHLRTAFLHEAEGSILQSTVTLLEQMETLLIPPAYRTSPPVHFWSFHYKWQLFSSFFQIILVIILKKKKKKSELQCFRIFNFQNSVALSSSDAAWKT